MSRWSAPSTTDRPAGAEPPPDRKHIVVSRELAANLPRYWTVGHYRQTWVAELAWLHANTGRRTIGWWRERRPDRRRAA